PRLRTNRQRWGWWRRPLRWRRRRRNLHVRRRGCGGGWWAAPCFRRGDRGAAGGGGGSNLVPAGGTSGLSNSSPSVTISYIAPAVACAPGFFSTTGSEPCTAAPKGYYVDAIGATSATPCAKGSYQPSTGQQSCLLASKGYYVDITA